MQGRKRKYNGLGKRKEAETEKSRNEGKPGKRKYKRMGKRKEEGGYQRLDGKEKYKDGKMKRKEKKIGNETKLKVENRGKRRYHTEIRKKRTRKEKVDGSKERENTQERGTERLRREISDFKGRLSAGIYITKKWRKW